MLISGLGCGNDFLVFWGPGLLTPGIPKEAGADDEHWERVSADPG